MCQGKRQSLPLQHLVASETNFVSYSLTLGHAQGDVGRIGRGGRLALVSGGDFLAVFGVLPLDATSYWTIINVRCNG